MMSGASKARKIDWDGSGLHFSQAGLLQKQGRTVRLVLPVSIGAVVVAGLAVIAAGQFDARLAIGNSAPATSAAPAEVVSVPLAVEAPEPQAEAQEDERVTSAAKKAALETGSAARQAEPDTLASNDPRWSNGVKSVVTQSGALARLKEAIEANMTRAEVVDVATSTAGIGAPAMPARATGYFPQRPEASEPADEAFDAALGTGETAGLVAAKATADVNMRAGPSDDAKILAVVPADSAIEAETDCSWCEVSYDGQTGYIYERFIAIN